MSAPSPSPPRERVAVKYKIHWHVLLSHFPVAAFLGALLFMALHLLSRDNCFVPAAYVSLIAGSLILLPTTATG